MPNYAKFCKWFQPTSEEGLKRQQLKCYYNNQDVEMNPIGIMVWVFANGPGDRVSILGRVKDSKKGTWCHLA